MSETTNSFQATENIGEKHKLLGLDHLRAIAISYVLLFHYQFFGHPEWVKKIAGFGWSGVDLFFVLSGFLISGQLFAAIAKGNKISLDEFFIKRFFRIIPPFLVVVILYAAFPFVREWGQLSPIWRYLTFTLNFGLNLREYGTFSHAWSLCVEEQFYLVLPLIFWLFSYFKGGSKKAKYLIMILFIGGFFIRLWSWSYFIEPVLGTDNYGAYWNKYIYYPTYNRLDSLLVGVSIAGIYTFYPKIKEWINARSNWILLIGLILLVAAGFVCKGYSTYNTTLWGFPLVGLSYGLMLSAVICPSSFVYHFKSFVTSWLATLSYSIYLSHKIVIHVTQNLFGRMGMDKNSGWMMAISMITVVGTGLIMRYTIEKPAFKLRHVALRKLKKNKKSKHQESAVGVG